MHCLRQGSDGRRPSALTPTVHPLRRRRRFVLNYLRTQLSVDRERGRGDVRNTCEAGCVPHMSCEAHKLAGVM
jgi:hypothetical protein